MRTTRRRFLGAAGAGLAAGLAGCSGGGPTVPSIAEAPGVAGSEFRFAYEATDVAIPRRPPVVLGRLDDLRDHGAHLADPPHALAGHEPLSSPVSDVVSLPSTTAYAKVAGARAFVGVDADAARSSLADAGEETTASGRPYFEGEDWAAAVTDDAVVEAAAPLVGSARERRQYATTIAAAVAGDEDRLLDVHEPSRRVADALPACQYVSVSPSLSDVDFRSEIFGVSVRGEQSVLATARLAADHRDPSKRNARLDVVDRWESRLTPDASVSNVTVLKDDHLVRVTGVVPTAKIRPSG
ncbi:twin-arginine translocation signal domain-containing protein [Halorubellus sp. JP-L1]|uniref:twin-arginine translocation signal domain-containing protein n=1 Tax=Halorubellus sp. JP-L1 TaxID=2715753 RepID=UPI001408C2A9|nr:twin-arginine translocation signal domain-containing protein [Halorubellus sp. JP-L1]NHN43124.1 twin-arginine translocation signal domain-containing protein [Halorubellus sp. JP-L1]